MTRSEYYDAVKEKYNISEDKRNIILIGTPDHGNLGDHAIAYATLKLLTEMFPDDHIFEINMHDFPFDIDAIYHVIKPADIIILQGGGNLGNVYMDDEMIRRYVVMRFTENKIIMFPQSVYFSNDAEGAEELAISSRIYGDNKNLYLIARDKRSEKFLKENFKNQVYRLPDVVLTLPSYHTSCGRNGVLLCLRNDRERVLSYNMQEDLKTILKKRFDRIERIDTVVECDPLEFNRTDELNKIWDKLSSAELIVTDRLHGVIFSALTGTPCIAFPDLNQKIQGVLDDLEDIKNIDLIDMPLNMDKILQIIIDKKNAFIQNESVLNEYRTIIKKILDTSKVHSKSFRLWNIYEIFQLVGYWNNQYYKTECWRKKISYEYKRIEKNNSINEKDMSTYKEWIDNLNKQLEQLKIEYNHSLKSIDERDAELKIYKEWVDNLNKQIEQLKNEYNYAIKK